MSDRDWDAELKKIDKQMEGVANEPLPSPRAAAGRAGPPGAASGPMSPVGSPMQQVLGIDTRKTTSFGVYARLTLSVALGVGIVFWPYSARCGWALAGYLGAVLAIIVSGGWSAIWTWRHRAARAHVLSLLLVVWGLVLASTEILPRVGYAIPTVAHPSMWSCAG